LKGFKEKFHFVIYALSILEADTMAGGYRIFIECLKQWLKQGCSATLITSEQGSMMVDRYIKSPNLKIIKIGSRDSRSKPTFNSLFYTTFLYVTRTFNGIFQSLSTSKLNQYTVFYSTTPFLPDILPALIMRLRNHNTLWLVAFSMYAPPIFGGWQSGLNRKSKFIEIRALAFKLNEIVAYPIVKRWADVIYVNNYEDLKRIQTDGVPEECTLVIGGGVDVELSDSVQSNGDIQYDAVFVGRFHPQKGVLELVDIWQEVCQALPSVRLVMIGNGPLEKAVAQKVHKLGIEKNIFLLGFKDGVEKLGIFRQSRIVLHPSLYDSGGMAAAEAMICGLPGVSYDLPALRTYYPKGMLKAHDPQEFAAHIIHLLTDSTFYVKMSNEAREWAKEWDWREVSQRLLDHCQSQIQESTQIGLLGYPK
jgi:glycosyltransferase involved in cell wall biosynthesis